MTHNPIACPHGYRWHLSCQACDTAQEGADKAAQAHADRLARARTLLDSHRAGVPHPAHLVNAALAVTGDLGIAA